MIINKANPLLIESNLNTLVTLEEQIVNDQVALETLQRSFTIITDLIEYYDSIKDPIKQYFVEKLQILLANRKINGLLEKTRDNSVQQQDNNVKFKEYSLKEKKRIRQKQIKIINEVMDKSQNNSQSCVQDLMVNFDQIVDNIDREIEQEKLQQEIKFQNTL